MPLEPRLATHMIVSSLIRQMAAQGDFATVLHKGDAIAGQLLLISRCKGQNPALYEQFPAIDGSRKWAVVPIQDTDKEQQITQYIERRVSRDPDIWILELDVAFEQRLNELLGLTA
jgi:hypothetical protein